jgi:hypothetical protein
MIWCKSWKTGRDILWRDSSGNVAVWLMNGLRIVEPGSLGMMPISWSIAETGDFSGDGKSDMLWRDSSTGSTGIWFMNGLEISQSASLGVIPANWTIQGLNAD